MRQEGFALSSLVDSQLLTLLPCWSARCLEAFPEARCPHCKRWHWEKRGCIVGAGPVTDSCQHLCVTVDVLMY